MSRQTSDKAYVEIPWPRFISMFIFIGAVAAGTLVKWPMGPMNLTWGAWLIGYGGYLVMWTSTIAFLIATRKGDG